MLFGTSSAQAAQSLPAGDPINDSLSRVAAVVDAPRTPSVPVIHNESIVDAGAIQIDVPIQSKRPVTGRNAGEVGLRGKQTDTDFVVQSQADRTRILSVSKSSAAPTVIKYRVVTDPSGTLALQPDGSVHVMNRDGLITSVIEAPWAIDAAGRSVTTSYTIAGSTLVQTIEHRAPGVTYPVTADPSVVSCSTFVACIKFNRSETLRVNNAAITGGSPEWQVRCAASYPARLGTPSPSRPLVGATSARTTRTSEPTLRTPSVPGVAWRCDSRFPAASHLDLRWFRVEEPDPALPGSAGPRPRLRRRGRPDAVGFCPPPSCVGRLRRDAGDHHGSADRRCPLAVGLGSAEFEGSHVSLSRSVRQVGSELSRKASVCRHSPREVSHGIRGGRVSARTASGQVVRLTCQIRST